ncbi:MAG: hypothetical protein AB7T63_13305 [Planctomycetota bacterium]
MSDDDLRDDDVAGDDGVDGGAEGYSEAHEAALAEAQAERLTRQAFVHGVDRQLFRFLFANCCFFAAALVSWEVAAPGADANPAGMIGGLDTVRGAMLLALAVYGFWTCFLNIFHGQMKVWPFLLSALIGAEVAIGGIKDGIASWDKVKEHLATLPSKTAYDDLIHRLGAISPGAWLCTIGSFLVFWVLLSGLMSGRSSSKASSGGGRRRR